MEPPVPGSPERELIIEHTCAKSRRRVLPFEATLVTGAAQVPAGQRAHLLDALLDSAADGILAHHPDGRLLYFNAAAHEMLGYSCEQFAALEPWGWIAEEYRDNGPARIVSILEDGWLTYESAALCHDGQTLPTEIRARRVETDAGPAIVSVIRDISERVAAQRQLLYMAFHDPLTGLANRALFDDRLGIAIANARRHGDMLGLAYIDLDEFKPVNDRYGHTVGDVVLQRVARSLERVVRTQDTVARLGGDEFVVLLPRLRSEFDLAVIGKKLCAAVHEPVSVDGHLVRVDASVGLTLFDPETDDERSLLVKADCAMYEAKRRAADDPCGFICDIPANREQPAARPA
jgi:diguanylate cyclase (GGDEF)-like protein/PAS domain S-box-containing protein